MRTRLMAGAVLAAVTGMLVSPGVARAQLSETQSFLATLDTQYQTLADVTYHVASGYENKLDLYVPRNADGPTPVVVWIHGGGWVGGTKEAYLLRLMPYFEMGWAVVNVEYRMAQVALAPAAVEDCLCALRWVVANAEQYNLDTSGIVVTGHSAGGHLALTTGMIPPETGLDRPCRGGGGAPIQVAAIVNWYGISDVVDLLDGPNQKSYAVQWLGSLPDREEVARRVSPQTYVRRNLPPILTIHGDSDPVVPYEQAVQLKAKLDAADVPNELHTVPGGGHGRFTPAQQVEVFDVIHRFFDKHGLQ